MRELLRNEVLACTEGPAQFIDNPGDGNDDGQDAETIRDIASAAGDTFIPSGTTVWQYKAERRPPNETRFKAELKKDRPKSVLDSGGNYRFIAQQPRTNESRLHALLQSVARQKGYRPEQVAFYAQARLAERARMYPSLAMLPFFRRPLDQVQNFGQWAARYATSRFDEQSRTTPLSLLTNYLQTSTRPGHVRIVGPAGVGKTRLVLHALEKLDLGACTVYAPNATSAPFVAFFKWCTEHNGRLVLVVDECDEPTAMRLRQDLVDHQRPILLITIHKVEDENIRANDRDLRIHLDPMTEEDIIRILDDRSIDRSHLYAIARISGGFVKLARVVAEAVARSRESVFDLSSLVTVDTIRDAVRAHLGVPEAVRWLGAIALFAEIRIDSSEEGSDLALLAAFAGVTVQDARTWNARAITAQVLSDRGARIFVTPALLAVLLARDFVHDHRHELPRWLRGLPPRLQESFAEQLGQLRYSDEGRALARELVDANGPFGDLLTERQSWARDAFLALGSVARPEALGRLEVWLDEIPTAAAELEQDRALRQLLFRLAWRKEHFGRTFRLILRGLQASKDPDQSGLYATLRGSLRVTLANSEAPFPDRLAIATRAVEDKSIRPEVRRLILRALARGTGDRAGDGYSHEDVDIRGREYWMPTYGEWRECTRSVVTLLAKMLSDADTALRAEAAANLIDRASEFIRGGAHEPLLDAINQLIVVDPRVGKLREELERSIAYGKLPDDIDRAVRVAIGSLPQDLTARIRVLVEGWPLVKDRAARRLPERPDAAALADEIMKSPERTSLIALLFEPWAKNSGDILALLAKREDAQVAWPAILVAARKNGETWGASLFLAVAHDAAHPDLQRVPAELLNSECEYDRNLGAETITRMEASDDELYALIDAIRQDRAKASSLRYAAMGRWIERRSAQAVADLIRATAGSKDGGITALEITHAAEANLVLANDEIVQLLASTMFTVQGHDAWTWEQVAARVAKRSPEALGQALIAQISKRPRDHVNRYMLWAENEVAGVIDRCINAVPSLALSLLELWDTAPDFVESLSTGSLLKHLEPHVLADWATDARRQRALAHIVVAAPHPTTEALLERFGARSTFAMKLREQLRPASWSGSLAELLQSRANDVRTWADDSLKGTEFREWARTSAEWLDKASEQAKLYDDWPT